MITLKQLTMEEWFIVILFILSLLFILFASKWSLSEEEYIHEGMLSYQEKQLIEVEDEE